MQDPRSYKHVHVIFGASAAEVENKAKAANPFRNATEIAMTTPSTRMPLYVSGTRYSHSEG